MRTALLLAGVFFLQLRAQAQGYSAPGMPLHLQRRVPPSAAKPQVATVASSILPRFWQQIDTAQRREAQQLYHFTNRQLKYPSNSLRAGIDGKLHVHLTVAADGSVSRATIIRRELKAEGGDAVYAEKGYADLDAEALRVSHSLRFKPSNVAVDTVTITYRFLMQ
ncbi:TonB family protein [Hymenobacter sp. BT683]|uniref:TonB family protein n=1 Tax=Hymenobacter jeongseonensis TaxID=2791027 RepID=A0ABS0IKI1_9BACT|nr:TonB family protein [Hymenobacter jeongseonensis]MBF9238882.1 TonB family protein [Hymenobacter jeongseonensis]